MFFVLFIAFALSFCVKATTSPINVYIKVIESPKINPLVAMTTFLSEPDMKKLTVIGIIGKTQGVNTPSKPMKSDRIKNPSKE